MIYTPFSLNGAWELTYSQDPYPEKECPRARFAPSAFGEPAGLTVEQAVPGYWEDMTDIFSLATFYSKLQINPEYGIQRYPMGASVPDMALPNVVGTFFYRRTFCCEGINTAASLWFSGVQNTASVWLNGVYLGRQVGYSTPFELPIPAEVLQDGENEIILAVSNHPMEGFEGMLVSGLTNRAANQYTGGITGDVELRVYGSALRDAVVLVSEDCSRVDVQLQTAGTVICRWAVLDGTAVCKQGTCEGDFSFDTCGLEFWSPESPKLYTLELTCGDCTLQRSFGVRRLTVDGVQLRLNGTPCFLRGVCEHCYFPTTVHPHHDRKEYRKIVHKLKELGFNFIRCHTFVPAEEYMEAADELGILVQVESPNNSTLEQWEQIVRFCRSHPSVVIYCCGNEVQMTESRIEHLHKCADAVHSRTDALFSPLSALRGLEYCWIETNMSGTLVEQPFPHNPQRFETVREFADLFNSYMLGQTSYFSLTANPQELDDWSRIYQRPRLSHEICIQGTYTDLSLKDCYRNSRVGKTQMFSSIEAHLKAKGVLEKAPLYFQNSCQWQRRLRKFCFESTRLCRNMAGYDFLGPIDTHWHTFGYDVGMMNEFYELKPGETVRNVRMYNSETVLLTDLGTQFNFTAGQMLSFGLFVSHFGAAALENAAVNLRLTLDGKLIASRKLQFERIENGQLTRLHLFEQQLPEVQTPGAMQLYVTLEAGDTYAENEWELYLFPQMQAEPENLLVAQDLDEEALLQALEAGKDVVLLGAGPFVSRETSFQQALAGRTAGHLATVVNDHPSLEGLPHDGFCGWQFRNLMEEGRAVCFESDQVPFDPVIEMVTPHKHVIRQAALFEFAALNGRLLVCSFRFDPADPAACWLKNRLIRYAQSEDFAPEHTLSAAQLQALLHAQVGNAAKNNNQAFNPNDKSAARKK